MAGEDLTDMLVEPSKRSLRVQLRESQVEDFDDVDAQPLHMLVWEVNTMKLRSIGFEARRLLSSPEASPPFFQHPKIINRPQKMPAD